MKLTITKIEFMHGSCDEKKCPICNDRRFKSIQKIHYWVLQRLIVTRSGYPKSPWWIVKEENEECYRILKGNLRSTGFNENHSETKRIAS